MTGMDTGHPFRNYVGPYGSGKVLPRLAADVLLVGRDIRAVRVLLRGNPQAHTRMARPQVNGGTDVAEN